MRCSDETPRYTCSFDNFCAAREKTLDGQRGVLVLTSKFRNSTVPRHLAKSSVRRNWRNIASFTHLAWM
jgi:hypothetical protein